MHPIEENDLESGEEIPLSSCLSRPWIFLHRFISSLLGLLQQNVGSCEQKIRLQLRSNYMVLIKAKINFLLPFCFLAISLYHLTQKSEWVIFFSLAGLIPLADRLDYASNQLAFYTGPIAGGLLTATFNNAMELINSILALKKGMTRFVQQSLLGSILLNLLLLVGWASFIGGIDHHKRVQVFNKKAAMANSELLLFAVMAIMFPTVLHRTHAEVHFGKSGLSLSRFCSCVMLVAYSSYIFFRLKSGTRVYKLIYNEKDTVLQEKDCYKERAYNDSDEEKAHNDSGEERTPEMTQWVAISWLMLLSLWHATLSYYFLNAIQEATESRKVSLAFISVILLPVAGKACSILSIFTTGELDIKLEVAIGSCVQISTFVIPLTVIVGWLMGQPMNLMFQPYETLILLISVLTVSLILKDGTSHYFKGLVLVMCYLLIAGSYYEREGLHTL